MHHNHHHQHHSPQQQQSSWGQNTNQLNPQNKDITVLAHLQDIGDRQGHGNEWIGTKGQSRRLEGFSVHRNVPNYDFVIEYFAHVQNTGDTGVVK